MSYTPLDLVEGVCRRYVLYPSEHAVVAHVLWIAHTHMMERWDTTPRIAFMSAEKESGKTRALEVTSLLVPTPIMSISASPAAIVRLITATTPTLLCDEIDAIFGSKKAEESNVDLRSVLNAGYRRGAYYYRCVAKGKEQVPEAMQCYAAAALAGLKTLPDTLASRAIFIHMRRRAPDEKLTPYRTRYAEAEAKPIREALEEWCKERDAGPVDPDLPYGITDRAADCWEPLLVVADEAGDDWPKRAREAAVYLTGATKEESLSPGVELLEHIKEAFEADEKLHTPMLLQRLIDREDSPWADIYGKPLDSRGLRKRLKPYGIEPHPVRLGTVAKGYTTDDFRDAWNRYLQSGSGNGYNGYNGYKIDNETKNVTNVTNVTEIYGKDSDEGRTGNEGEGGSEGCAAGVVGLGQGNGKGHQIDLEEAIAEAKAKVCPACDGRGCPTCIGLTAWQARYPNH